jgi:hypothetical protein
MESFRGPFGGTDAGGLDGFVDNGDRRRERCRFCMSYLGYLHRRRL